MSDPVTAYRARAAHWLEGMAPVYGREARRGLSQADDLALGRRWQAEKHAAGYAGIAWPDAHGGQGLGPLEKLAFEVEELRHGFPNEYFGVSLGMPVPIMLRYLPDGWKQDRARAALRGEEIWCQLFSEPAAGSDLAGIRTAARRDPASGDWIVNGQKLWTTYAQFADYAVILVRTDPTVPKHRGLTYFWLDMQAPGVTVRPIRTADGGSEINEVFLDDVRIPDAQRLGAVGGGFAVAIETLMIERYTATDPAGYGPPLALLIGQARDTVYRGRAAIEDGRVRERIARAHAVQSALGAIHRDALAAIADGREPGPEGSIHKLVAMRARQRLSEFAMDLRGLAGLRHDDRLTAKESWSKSWLSAPKNRIAGGADEMLLNTIAEKILGLPQDHRPDKGVPFDAIE